MKKLIKGVLRILGLMQVADRLRYSYLKIKNRKRNRLFRQDHPEVVLPPDYMMYEAFGLDYYRYYVNGRKSAKWVVDLVLPFLDLKAKHILDWGCGPGRIIRHLPDLVPEAAGYAGTDYNPKTIDWCSAHLPGIRFMKNNLNPPVPAEATSYDLIYGISIFTHLSEEAHHLWLNELCRLLKPEGVLLLTLHGEAFAQKLGTNEASRFHSGQLVVRGQVKEGHRTFIAWHPEQFVRQWTRQLKELKHLPGQVVDGVAEQDTWIFQKL